MKSSEQLKLDIISKLSQNKITRKQAIQILNVSERSVLRYLKKYNEKGFLFVKHGNRNKEPKNKTSFEIKKEVIKLVREKYFDFNMTHCLEKLKENHNIIIGREKFRRWCHEIKMVKHAHKRRGSKIRRRRDRMAMPGVMLQMDGSPHKWFGGKESCLIATIDDANNEVAFAEFFPAEDTISCMVILQKVIEKKGRFDILYTDKAGIFAGPKRARFSQVKRALKELSIEIIYADSAEAKGRIERLWKTLQDRLIPEMRLKGIKSYRSANKYLQEQFLIKDYSEKFEVVPVSLETAYRAVSKAVDLNEVFCLKEYRTVKRDHTLSWNSDLYDIKSDLKYSIYSQKIEIRTYQNLTWKAFFANKEIKIEKVNPVIKKRNYHEKTNELRELNSVKVQKNNHVKFKNKFYSLNEMFSEEEVLIKEESGHVYIYHQNKIVEVHELIKNKNQISFTKSEHMSAWRESLNESSFYRTMARRSGLDVESVIIFILKIGNGFIDTKSIFSIINLEKIYLRSALNETCGVALDIGNPNYGTIKKLLNLKGEKYKKKIEEK